LSEIFPGFPNLETVNLGVCQGLKNIKGILKYNRKLLRKGGKKKPKENATALFKILCFRARSYNHMILGTGIS
jgi:hypothetical protein